MVITPKQASAKFLADNADKLKTLEAMIDKSLVADFKSGLNGDVCINASGVYPGHPVFEKLKQMYGAAGWNIKYESDQRDGDYMRFTPR